MSLTKIEGILELGYFNNEGSLCEGIHPQRYPSVTYLFDVENSVNYLSRASSVRTHHTIQNKGGILELYYFSNELGYVGEFTMRTQGHLPLCCLK